MKKNLYEILNGAEPEELDLFEKESKVSPLPSEIQKSISEKVYAKTGLKKEKKRAKVIWFRVGSFAACFLLIFGAFLSVSMLQKNNRSDNDIPTQIISKNQITGKQEVIYGNYKTGAGVDASRHYPGFRIRTVIEAEVIEVLPDTYYLPVMPNTTPNPEGVCRKVHVAKLRVLDEIRAEGLPAEIYLSYSFYDTDIFDEYDRFILSLEQVGVENYMMINETQKRFDYFSNMFEVWLVRDLGYGSVIAFNDGVVDEGFWQKANRLTANINYMNAINSLLDKAPQNSFPASHNSTIEEVKSNIKEIAKNEDTWEDSKLPYHYVTAEDIFISQEGKKIQSYVAPGDTNVFMQSINIFDTRVVARYTRIINGFLTDESIVVNGGMDENGKVTKYGNVYTSEDFGKIPDLGYALENLKISELKPPHIEVAENMQFAWAVATGYYRKANGKLYGVVRIMWCYETPEMKNTFLMDDCYYLYDENGNGSVLEREELKEILGNDPIIETFTHNEIYSWD